MTPHSNGERSASARPLRVRPISRVRPGSLLVRIVRLIWRQRRRLVISLGNLGLSLAVLCGLGAVRPIARGETTSPDVGVTFSRRQAEYLGLAWKDTFSAVLSLSPTVVRLGAYWDEIERQPGVYDFSSLDWQLERLPASTYRVVLTVGMKAPRWPEYYLPSWLLQQTRPGFRATVSDDARVRAQALKFVEAVVTRYQGHSSIGYWQVENEPLDPAGPRQWRIGADFVEEEVQLVRSLDQSQRPIILSMFVGTPPPLASLPPWRSQDEGRARALLNMADILGLDLYPSRGIRVFGHDLYLDWSGWGWERSAMSLRQLALDQGKDAWVMEAQAEPWEPSQVVYLDGAESRSVGPGTAASTFDRLSDGGFGTILLWGAEHWYMRQEKHDDRSWLDTLRPLFRGGEQSAAQATAPKVPAAPPTLGPPSDLGR